MRWTPQQRDDFQRHEIQKHWGRGLTPTKYYWFFYFNIDPNSRFQMDRVFEVNALIGMPEGAD